MRSERLYTRSEVEEIATMCAGATSGVFMRRMPDLVMPTEEIHENIAAVFAEHDAGEIGRMLEAAWGIIANANFGNWDGCGPEWQQAAERWRDRYHAWIDSVRLRADGMVMGVAQDQAQDVRDDTVPLSRVH